MNTFGTGTSVVECCVCFQNTRLVWVAVCVRFGLQYVFAPGCTTFRQALRKHFPLNITASSSCGGKWNVCHPEQDPSFEASHITPSMNRVNNIELSFKDRENYREIIGPHSKDSGQKLYTK